MEEVSGRALIACKRLSRAARTCGVTASADTGMRTGSGCGARDSAGFNAGLLWKRERHRDAQREGLGAAGELLAKR
jgi:hypothetical protein